MPKLCYMERKKVPENFIQPFLSSYLVLQMRITFHEDIFSWTVLRLVTFYVYSSDIWETYIHSCTKAPPISVFAWLTGLCPLYFVTQYVGAYNTQYIPAPAMVFALETYWPGDDISHASASYRVNFKRKEKKKTSVNIFFSFWSSPLPVY